ncbi:MAG: PKD domain-containing protein [Bacteroidetes bacterium]|nr:PKD domain-containing protein [Bacteroidota bacterium]
MYRLLLIFTWIVSTSFIIQAQVGSIEGTEIFNFSSPSLDETFKAYSVFQIPVSDFNKQIRKKKEGVNLRLKLGNLYDWQMYLYSHNIKGKDYSLRVSSENGIQEIESAENKTFKGHLYGVPDAGIRLTVAENFIYGYVEQGAENFFIEPLHYFVKEAPKDIFVVYASSEVYPRSDLKCGWSDMHRKKQGFEKKPNKKGPAKILGNCYTVEIALASDYSMFQEYGSIAGVENQTLGVLNNVQGNYDDEFEDEINFSLVTQFVSNCSSCDPWTSSLNPDNLLDDFRGWGNSGGFGVSFDVASLWSRRSFIDDIIGLAWVNAVCSSYKYNVLEDFTGNAALLRVLQAHELGHNFDASHDAAGSPYIMAPSVGNVDEWSATSVSMISENISDFLADLPDCLTGCGSLGPPVADFSANVTVDCAPFVVSFQDMSQGIVTSWNWSFPGGSPASSNDPDPNVTYSQAGIYDVELEVSNSGGSNSIYQSGYIEVLDGPEISFSFYVQGALVEFTNTTPEADNYFWDFGDGNTSNAENPIYLYDEDGVYQVELTALNECGLVSLIQEVTIITAPLADFNAAETIGCAPFTVSFFDASSSNATEWFWTFEGGTPSTSTNSDPIIIYDTPGTYSVTLEVSNAQGANTITQNSYITVEDVPSVSFEHFENDFTVTFINNSTNADNYLWNFGDGNTSTDESPDHIYQADGSYQVTLTAFNNCGETSFTSEVEIITLPIANFSSDNTNGCIPFTVAFMDLSSINATSWTWTFEGGTPSSSAEQNPTVVYEQAGTYTVVLQVENESGADIIEVTDYIVVGTTPVANFNFQQDFAQVQFENNSFGSDTYLWDFGDGNSSTEENPLYEYSQDGQYTVSLTATNECGSENISQTITIITPPTAGFSLSVQQGCAPFSVFFSDQSTDNTTVWSWVFEGGNPATSIEQNPVVSYEIPGNYSVTLQVSNASGTDQMVIESQVLVGIAPAASFSTDITDRSVQFSNSSEYASSVTWNFGDGNDSNVFAPTHTYSADGSYLVTLTVENECGTDVYSEMITVITPPTANFSSSLAEGCIPFEVSFTDQSSANATQWLWTFEGGDPATSSEQNPMVVYEIPGTYSVSLVASNNVGSNTFSSDDYIVIGAPPEAAFSALINGANISLTNTSSDNASSYLWDFGDGRTSEEDNPVHQYDLDGTYIISLTVYNDCGSMTSSKTITIVTPPSANFSVEVTEGCTPFSVAFMDQSSYNAAEWFWTFEGGTPSTSTEQNPIVTYEMPGMFEVSLAVSNAAGTDTYTQASVITVGDVPLTEFSEQVQDSVVQFFNSSQNADTYFWDFGDGDNSTESAPTHIYKNDGIYTVQLTATNNCGSTTYTQEVIIAVILPIAVFSTETTTVCPSQNIHFFNQSSENSTSYEWHFPGGEPEFSTQQHPTIHYPQSGQYTVTLISYNLAGSDTLLMQDYITISDLPVSDFDFSVDSIQLSFANTSVDGDTYFWDFGDGDSSTEENPEHWYPHAGNYLVSLTVSNECGDHTFEQEVATAGSIPQATFSADVLEENCIPFEIHFWDASSGIPASWQWSFPGGNPESSTEQNPVVVYENAGVYDVSLEVSNGFGNNVITESSFIVAFESPAALFSLEQNGRQISIENFSSGSSLEYEWNFGDGTIRAEENPMIHQYQENGEYVVSLTVSNNCGSDVYSDTLNISVDLKEKPAFIEEFLIIPNPNSGRFSVVLKGQPVHDLRMSLIDIFGHRLFEERFNYSSGHFERSFDFDNLPTGVYILQFETGNNAIYRKMVIEK